MSSTDWVALGISMAYVGGLITAVLIVLIVLRFFYKRSNNKQHLIQKDEPVDYNSWMKTMKARDNSKDTLNDNIV